MKLLVDYYQDDTYFYRSETNLDKTFVMYERQASRSGIIGDEKVLWLNKTPNSLIIVTDGEGSGHWIHVHIFRLVDKLETPLAPECPECGEKQADCDCVFCKRCHGIAAETALCPLCKTCSDCCECPVCSRCDDRAESVCSRCDSCPDCCDCSHCVDCGPCEYSCGNCQRCGDHCDCITCPHCEENFRNTSICRTCDRCSHCCECDDDNRNIPGDEDHSGPRRKQKFKFFKPVNLAGFKSLKIRRPISIELELSSVPKRAALVEWANKTNAGLVQDGSIPREGCEINTNPASGDEHVKMMQGLSDALRKSKAEVTDACGLHVHVDASDISQFDLRRLMMFWIAVEPSIFEMVSKSRYGNHYCQDIGARFAKLLTEPIGFPTWNQRLSGFLYKQVNQNVTQSKREKYHDSRYGALNLHSYFYRKPLNQSIGGGTIEFRLHEARIEPYILLHWPILCAAIVDYCQKQTEKNILSLIRTQATSESILAEALPDITRLWMQDRLESRREARKTHRTERETETYLMKLHEARKILTSGIVWTPQNPKVKLNEKENQ